MLYYVHGLLVGSCGTIQLQDVQTAYLAAATTTSSTPDYSTEMNGAGEFAPRVPTIGTGSRQ